MRGRPRGSTKEESQPSKDRIQRRSTKVGQRPMPCIGRQGTPGERGKVLFPRPRPSSRTLWKVPPKLPKGSHYWPMVVVFKWGPRFEIKYNQVTSTPATWACYNWIGEVNLVYTSRQARASLSKSIVDDNMLHSSVLNATCLCVLIQWQLRSSRFRKNCGKNLGGLSSAEWTRTCARNVHGWVLNGHFVHLSPCLLGHETFN